MRSPALQWWGVAAAAFAMAGIAPAHAQINPFRGYKGPTLTRADLAAGQTAALTLLNDDPATVGQQESWTGSASRNHGTLTISRVFDRNGMPCRAVTSDVTYAKTRAQRSYTLNACRIATGGWKLAD